MSTVLPALWKSSVSRHTAAAVLSAATTSTIVIGLLLAAEHAIGLRVFGLPYVACAALIALMPSAPPARPGVILRAYPAATIGALAITELLAPSQTAAALSAVTAVAVMVFLRAPHVPAALCAGGIGLADPGFAYLWQTLVPALVIVLLGAAITGRIVPGFSYPPAGARRRRGPVESDRIIRFRMGARSK